MTAFASALKNITVYPPEHPRVVERATAFATAYVETVDRPQQLEVHKDGFAFDGERIDTDHLALAWLHARCRETGTGAIHLEPRCGPGDVIRFATAMIECRPGSGTSLAEHFPDASAAVRPVALVVEERNRAAPTAGEATGRAGEQPAQREPAGPSIIDATASLTDKLRAIANLPSVVELTEAIAACESNALDPTADQSPNEPRTGFDLVEVVAEVLPVDCPSDPAGLQETIEDILRRTHAQLQLTANSERSARSADLLRSAVDIAKTYFGRSNEELDRSQEAPRGRPEDDAIQADVALLTVEMAGLPQASDLRLPAADELGEQAPATTRELLGICLHGLVHGTPEARASQRTATITRLVRNHPDECGEVLDSYLQPGAEPVGVRLPVLRALVHSGLDAIVRERRYLDDDLLRAGFPEILPIAARTFATRNEHARVRSALDDLATMIENGGLEVVAQARVLDDIATMQLLIHCGGKAAWQLLSHCAPEAMHAQRMLLQCAQGLQLPEPERVVVHVCASLDLPMDYLRRMLKAAALEQFDEGLRRESAGFLRQWVDANIHKQTASHLATAVQALRFAPGATTTSYLQELARSGRFSLRPGPRELRQHALATLKQLATEGAM